MWPSYRAGPLGVGHRAHAGASRASPFVVQRSTRSTALQPSQLHRRNAPQETTFPRTINLPYSVTRQDGIATCRTGLHKLSARRGCALKATSEETEVPDTTEDEVGTTEAEVGTAEDVEIPVETVTVRILYNRPDGEYDGWGLHAYGGALNETSWTEPLAAMGSTDYGVYWEVPLEAGAEKVEFIVHRGDQKDCEGAIPLSEGCVAHLVSCRNQVFPAEPDLNSFPQGNLYRACAVFASADVILWDVPALGPDGAANVVTVHGAAQLELSAEGISASDDRLGPMRSWPCAAVEGGAPPELRAKYPHLAGWTAFRLPPGFPAEALRCHLAVAAQTAGGRPLDATSLQLAGALDAHFAYDGPLGATLAADGAVQLAVWAPTAHSVTLYRYDAPTGTPIAEEVPMKEEGGVWRVEGPASWQGSYYQYEVIVYSPATNRVERSVATDPYARSLSANGERTHIADLAAADLAPPGWGTLAAVKPPLEAFTDAAIYELHIRDFSALDESVPAELRGKYLAFGLDDSYGGRHLAGLARAGMTHVHLLPAYDFGSVNERAGGWKEPEGDLASMAPDSTDQQAAVCAIQNEDGFNWGYDPVHYGVPDGSYATDPDGAARVLEFRTMVQALNKKGLRVVVDVVYNHTLASGPHSPLSVLDKIVPGYYHRRNQEGWIENSTCCNNTASENYMMGRLICDDLVHWAKTYKLDGFRFDLMGHIMLSTMEEARDRLAALTVEADGVDGSKIYLYGEGWDFAEVHKNRVGVNASQANLAGTGIGSFNDRMRETANGGSPFADPRLQGFVTGLYLQPNGYPQGALEEQRHSLAYLADRIQVSLAGNLRDFELECANGKVTKGGDLTIGFDGEAVGYAGEPSETVNYVSAHDNETLFDTYMLKSAPENTIEDRCRMNHLATALVALGQGIPFFHAGDELLRSKSLDRDSYNSGDWFNRLDFSYETNNFGVGLPPWEKNEPRWEVHRPLLGDPTLKPERAHILAALHNMHMLLYIRRSSPLFRLRTAADINARVTFCNTGPEALPGVIAMSAIDGSDASPDLPVLDAAFQRIVTIFNARPDEAELTIADAAGAAFELHPVQAACNDALVRDSTFDVDSGLFTVPARTTAVFVVKRSLL